MNDGSYPAVTTNGSYFDNKIVNGRRRPVAGIISEVLAEKCLKLLDRR